MQLRAYTVYDNKALVFHAPFFAISDGAAVRIFMDLANDTNTTIGRHPMDYSLWCVGTFQDDGGLLKSITPAEHVSDAISLVRTTPPDLFKKAAE